MIRVSKSLEWTLPLHKNTSTISVASASTPKVWSLTLLTGAEAYKVTTTAWRGNEHHKVS